MVSIDGMLVQEVCSAPNCGRSLETFLTESTCDEHGDRTNQRQRFECRPTFIFIDSNGVEGIKCFCVSEYVSTGVLSNAGTGTLAKGNHDQVFGKTPDEIGQ